MTDKPMPAAIQQENGIAVTREEGLLQRWSRRKVQARQETPSPVPGDGEETRAMASTASVDCPETPTPPVPTDADMPPIGSLDQNSDYRPFMSPGVSEELRTHALRRMFHSGLFNERCPLDGEYYDCHGYEPLGSVITYEMREEMERAANALKQKAKQALRDPEPSAAARTESSPVPAQEGTASPSPLDSDMVKEG